MPIDIIVQRDRTYGTAEDVGRKMAAFKQDMAEFDRQITENGTNDPGLMAMLATMEKLADAMKIMLGINPKVHLVAPKSIARSEGKAVRVVDKRKLI
jgi:phenylacetate-coenzyme A ligase PaaK-like adenylate-forming protein